MPQSETTWISKKYKKSKLKKKSVDFNDFVDVFEDKINGWYLNWARSANKNRHAGFIALLIGFSYFEAITIFKNGKENGSFKDFREAFKEIFNSDLQAIQFDEDKILNFLYKEGRCGFFHSGMARKGIRLANGYPTIRIKPEDISSEGFLIKVNIDRNSFIERISKHFEKYISDLRDTSNVRLRENFKKSWNKIHEIEL